MSWTQGVQTREDLPEVFVIWADSKVEPDIRCECVVWDDTQPGVYQIDYYSIITKKYVKSLTFRIKNETAN